MPAAVPRLSVRQVTGKPIVFVGTGEKSEALELFHPERIASRILGMGDVLSRWSSRCKDQVDQEKAAKLAKKISKGKAFDLDRLTRSVESAAENGRACPHCLDKLPAQMQANAAAATGRRRPQNLETTDGDHRLDDRRASGADLK